jgi:DNA-binding transcriptional LysR family regulator
VCAVHQDLIYVFAVRIGLKQIEYFRAIMVTGSVSGAAALLNVSQPNVSRMLKYTESRLGVPLFERRHGRLQRTPEADALFKEVQPLYAHLESLQAALTRIVHGESGRFPIGASPSLGRYVVPMLLSRLRKQFPKLAVKLDILSVSQAVDYLAFGQGECACTIFPIEHPQIQTEAFATGGLMCMVPRKHRLASRKIISAQDLLSEPLIGFEPSTPHGQVVAAFFEQAGLEPRFASLVRFAESACALAEHGHGIALVDEFTSAGDAFPDLIAVPLKCRRPFRLFFHRSAARPPSVVGLKFRQLLSQWEGLAPRE